jgi:uncharacterized protein YbjQ (UPF0145 family)
MRYLDFFAAAALVLTAGCVSYEYKGESAGDPSSSVAVFMNATKVRRTYQVLGEATVSGDCRDVSRERLMNKLISEAEKNGADAVLVVEQQVLPYGTASSAQGRFMTAYDYDDVNHSWSQVYRDVDQRYTNLFNTSLQGVLTKDSSPAAASNPTAARGYRRIIRAEFLKYTDNQPIVE